MLNQNIQVHYISAAVATAGVLGVGYIYYKYQKNKLPTTWTHVGKIDNLYIYPVKSCAPVEVDRAETTYLGLKQGWLRDRFLMVIDEKNNFISARVYPELLLVHPTVKSSILSLRHVDMEPLYVNLAEVVELQKPFTAVVWGCDVQVLDCGQEASEWFSKLLNRADIKFRLVYYGSQNCRVIRDTPHMNYYSFRKTDTEGDYPAIPYVRFFIIKVAKVPPMATSGRYRPGITALNFKLGYKDKTISIGALPDETAFNLINKASIVDLNSRLTDVQVDHRWFRPNFTVSGAGEYDEDKWDFVKIGENVFKILKPCTRCLMTVIDPETGIRHPKTQPFETLRSYRLVECPEERKVSSSPRMGVQLVLRSGPGGPISVQDDVYVSYK